MVATDRRRAPIGRTCLDHLSLGYFCYLGLGCMDKLFWSLLDALGSECLTKVADREVCITSAFLPEADAGAERRDARKRTGRLRPLADAQLAANLAR